MSRNNPTRTQTCDPNHARTRIAASAKFLEVAQLLEDDDEPASRNVAASLSVLAGVAASDAACCLVLGRRSRGEDHHDAERLLAEIVEGGKDAANSLRRLIVLKDKAQYGMSFLSRSDLKTAMKQAKKLLDFATGLQLM